jgi:KRAB domain-containing zinc finger protein
MSSEEKPENPDERNYWNEALDLRMQQPTTSNEKVRPFECLICRKTFRNRGGLNEHSMVHSDRKDFKCPICEKSFKVKRALNRHLPIHQNKKEFECKVCGKAFNTNANLYQHKRAHEPGKNFNCPECEKSFKWKHDLKKHSIKHSEIRSSADKNRNSIFVRNCFPDGH